MAYSSVIRDKIGEHSHTPYTGTSGWVDESGFGSESQSQSQTQSESG